MQLTPHASALDGYDEQLSAVEIRSLRTSDTISVRTSLESGGYAVLVLEEQ